MGEDGGEGVCVLERTVVIWSETAHGRGWW